VILVSVVELEGIQTNGYTHTYTAHKYYW